MNDDDILGQFRAGEDGRAEFNSIQESGHRGPTGAEPGRDNPAAEMVAVANRGGGHRHWGG